MRLQFTLTGNSQIRMFHVLFRTSLIESYDFRRARLRDLDVSFSSNGENGFGEASPEDLSALHVGDISVLLSERFDERPGRWVLERVCLSQGEEDFGSEMIWYSSEPWSKSCTCCMPRWAGKDAVSHEMQALEVAVVAPGGLDLL